VLKPLRNPGVAFLENNNAQTVVCWLGHRSLPSLGG
jgi:hypothetical protein